MSSVIRTTDDCVRLYDDDRQGQDACFMNEALALARSGSGRTWPNPPVGAVVVKDGLIVGRGAHAGPGQAHAEPIALQDAGEQAKGATLYCTLEPCNHEGRTAPCAPTVVAAGISRVVVAMRDPNPTVSGGGLRCLRERGIEVQCGVQAEQALDLVWPFVATDNFTRTYVELKTATSLDGCFAPLPSERDETAPVYLTGLAARREVHLRRRHLDLVLVGLGTVQADRPTLDGRLVAGRPDVPSQEPAAGYVDTNLAWTGGLPRDSYYVFAGEAASDAKARAAIEKDGGKIVFCPQDGDRIAPRDLLAACTEHDLLTVMLEGGPTLAASFLAEGLIDRWTRYTAPVVLGRGLRWPDVEAGGALPLHDLQLTRCRQIENDLLTVYDRKSFNAVLGQVSS